MSLLPYFILLATPFVVLVTGFISSLIFIQRISNQLPLYELVMFAFGVGVLGALGLLVGGFIFGRMFGQKSYDLLTLILLAVFSTPLVAFVTGFISSVILIELISNQSPSNEQVIVVFFLTLLGMVAGGLIGYFLCPYKGQPGGWSFNFLPSIFIFFGLWLGGTVIPWQMSYLLATTQQWVNNPWPSSEQIFLIFLLILVVVIVWWLTLLKWIEMNN